MISYTQTLLYTQYGVWAVVAASASMCAGLFGYQPIDTMSPGVLAWWTALCVVSIFNIWMWRASARALALNGGSADPTICRFQNRQLFLAAVFVLGCAFRSMVPRADVQRIGLIDSWLSSVFVGRSVATAAEICFAVQWALVVNLIARDAQSPMGTAVSWLLAPLILVAEGCSWYAVLTTSFLGNVIEESIWATCALLVVVTFAAMWSRSSRAVRPFLATSIVLGAAYVLFMWSVDIPMYASRWRADEAMGREYLSLSQGAWDAASRWVVTHSWEQWRSEMAWMFLYFSVCVWCSIGLVHLPGRRQIAH